MTTWSRALCTLAGVLAALALAGPAPAAPAAQSDTVAYTVTPAVAGADAVLRIDMSFRAGAVRRTWIRLPGRFGAERELWRNLRSLRATGASLAAAEPGVVVLTHAPGAQVRLAYEVRPPTRQAPAAPGVDYRPEVSPEGFSAFGETVFAYPEGRPRALASLRFGPLPAGWSAASDAETAGPETRTLVELLESVVAGGADFRLLRRDLGGGELRVAVRGRFGFSDEAFADRLARIVRAERTYFGEAGGGYLAILRSQPPRARVNVQSGVGRAHGAALFATADSTLQDLDYVIAHESAHAWFVGRLGGLPKGEAESAAYWFSEGFTDFFALRLLLRSGLIDIPGYARQLWSRTREARAMPNAELAGRYWSEPALSQLPYGKGLLLALYWDARLRKASGGRLDLDDVLKAQLVRAGRGPSPTAGELFPAVFKEVSGLDIGPDIERFLGRGELPLLPPDAYPGCVQRLLPSDGEPADAPPPGVAVPIGRGLYLFLDVEGEDEARCRALLSGA